MGIGASLSLIAIGLILALAVDVSLGGIDITTIGWILTIVGVVGLVLFFTVWRPRRTMVTADPTAPPTVVEERRTYEDPRI
ncbi:MAG: hypothetical protein GXX79_04030 [Actinomycetales bacterium]|nr:hypothetical protein [Actinomycetales bacterium]